MSIINDALKRAGKSKHAFQHQSSQILGKIGNLKIEAERFVLSKWLFWTSTGLVCLLGVVLAFNAVKEPVDKTVADSSAVEEIISASAVLPGETQLTSIIEADSESTRFNLSGILYDQQKPLAIINQQVVEEGGLISGAKLLEIQPDYVRLSWQGEEFELGME